MATNPGSLPPAATAHRGTITLTKDIYNSGLQVFTNEGCLDFFTNKIKGKRTTYSELLQNDVMPKPFYDRDEELETEPAKEYLIDAQEECVRNALVQWEKEGIQEADIAIAARHRWVDKKKKGVEVRVFKVSFRLYVQRIAIKFTQIKNQIEAFGQDKFWDTSVYSRRRCLYLPETVKCDQPGGMVLKALTHLDEPWAHITQWLDGTEAVVDIPPPKQASTSRQTARHAGADRGPSGGKGVSPEDACDGGEEAGSSSGEESGGACSGEASASCSEGAASGTADDVSDSVWGVPCEVMENIIKGVMKEQRITGYILSKRQGNRFRFSADAKRGSSCPITGELHYSNGIYVYARDDGALTAACLADKHEGTGGGESIKLIGRWKPKECLIKPEDPVAGKSKPAIAGSYDIVKARFEQTHAKIMVPVCFLEDSRNEDNEPVLVLRSKQHLKDAFENLKYSTTVQGKDGTWQTAEPGFISAWLKDPSMRTFNGLGFMPPPQVCPPNFYNTFSGFAAARLPSPTRPVDLTPIFSHVESLAGDTGKLGRDFILNYLAHLVQLPGILPLLGLIFQSQQGPGKNLFFDYFVGKKIIGTSQFFCSEDSDDFFGRFGSKLAGNLLCIYDEAKGSDTNKVLPAIKAAITSIKVGMEDKGLKKVWFSNYARLIFFTNYLLPLKMEMPERRMWAVRCASKFLASVIGKAANKLHFQKLKAWMDDDTNVRAFYDFLMARDISKWHPEHDRPASEMYTDMGRMCLSRVDEWLVNLVEENKVPSEPMTNAQLLSLFAELHMPRPGCANTFVMPSATMFGTELKLHRGVTCKKVRGVIRYTINHEDLKAGLIAEGKMDADGPDDEETEDTRTGSMKGPMDRFLPQTKGGEAVGGL